MSKNFNIKNRSTAARPPVSITAMVSGTKGRLVLAVACITAVGVASLGKRDLSAIDQFDSGGRASVKLGPPSFVVPQNPAVNRTSPPAVVVTQTSAMTARTNAASGRQILQLIDPSDNATGDAGEILIRPRLGSSASNLPPSNAQAMQFKSISDETPVDDSVAGA